ncbi:MAG: bifunctional 5,10-methylenetetrahydrofolate dehydrogenase/5,10-methenyltetrahydrofolate cyclohydrolase [Patescibacteria group bacterium]|nr:bifunctional 5,10-methylenetetrahydrofolate dehydrogenase/5,10-methenyltetrahydrofolate cyclohydrolase [Patescibacteria group bacterium]MDE2015205.1 bifunctional 5,10-methylenetetrahydrofolate dehydrogenase/5,10-methenyltetrahydrofolate cyclohydrolase [Patescibacteria group bacterium]MDE2226632.1 bifunctional 5,10-methylenetetrahydrofolate dehydrogenase/5,10-methenyltetrahydrofolate cyclohydrolase [Patescibacteria group bacterium]
MTAINGKEIAAGIIERLKLMPKPTKFFGIILVGNDQSSVSFIKQKEKTAKELGVDFRIYKFPPEMKNDELRDEVRKLAEHTTCGGVVVQLPLPEHLNSQYVINVIPREKDVDVLGERSLGAFYAGRNPVLPPAVGVVEEILKTQNYDLKNSSVAVVGLGPLVGKPISMWLVKKVAGLFLVHRGSDFSELKKADLVITGVGSAGLIKPGMLKLGTGVIDFGYDNNKGDLDSTDMETGWHTPTPGGTGPILVAKVFENFYKLNEEK